MAQVHFKNFMLLEPRNGELRGGHELRVENDRVRECKEGPINSKAADVIDCGGRTLMPGLIDCHVHVIHSEVNIRFSKRCRSRLLTASCHAASRHARSRLTTVLRYGRM
jgi:imidazolonepropionase-like amidohydrolase